MNQLKFEIASVAARFIVEDGANYFEAKSKAQELMFKKNGAKINKKNLPNNFELEAAVKKHSILFFKTEYIERLTELRRKAKDLMKVLETFNPLLIGSIANEAVTRYSDIRVCCFTYSTKEIAIELLNKGFKTDSHVVKHPLHQDHVEALSFLWKKEEAIIYALIHLESKVKLRGLDFMELSELINKKKM